MTAGSRHPAAPEATSEEPEATGEEAEAAPHDAVSEDRLLGGRVRLSQPVEGYRAAIDPVFLAAATTVLGMIPLLADLFWVGMAVTVMAGLTFGSILTMILVPVLYATIYKVHPDDRQAPSAPTTDSAMQPAFS